MMSIGEQLKKFRVESGKTQQGFADEIGISREFLSQVERNEKELSHGTALMIQDAIDARRVPLSYKEKYSMGQNFANIIDVLKREKPLSDLRYEFGVKGSDLSFMYIGLKPIPEKIKNILVKKYHVNWAYVLDGPRSPMFTAKGAFNDSMPETPYYTGIPINEAINAIVNNKPVAHELICLPYKGIDAYVDSFGDTMYPKFVGGEILGIKKCSKEKMTNSGMYILQLNSGGILLCLVNWAGKKNKAILGFGNQKYRDLEIGLDEVGFVFECKVIISHIANAV